MPSSKQDREPYGAGSDLPVCSHAGRVQYSVQSSATRRNQEKGTQMYSYSWDGYELGIRAPGGTIWIEGEEAGEIMSELEEAETVGEIQGVLQQAVMVTA